MTVTLHLRPEVEAGLEARALASGMALEAYLLTLMEQAALVDRHKPLQEEISERSHAVDRMLAFGHEHCLSLGKPATRGMLHEGHRY